MLLHFEVQELILFLFISTKKKLIIIFFFLGYGNGFDCYTLTNEKKKEESVNGGGGIVVIVHANTLIVNISNFL
jgi:hypothetical protein